jgi:predicted permease
MMGRLSPGATLESAQSEADTAAAALAASHPDSNRGMGFVVEPIWKATYGASSRFAAVLLALFAAVALVLLVACANVAGLLLVRATGRRREIAVRLALGSTRGRLVRQLVTESVVLSLLGGAAGLVLIPYVNALIAGILPPGIPLPIDLDPALDGRVLGFGLVLSLGTGILFGLAPALQASRPDLLDALGDSTVAAGAGPGRRGLRRVLVASQIALALVLLAATGLFVKSLGNANRIDPGFDRDNVLLVGFDFPGDLDRTRTVPFYRRVLERVATVPGVVAASYGNHPPLWLEGGDWEEVRVDGYTPGPDENMKIDVTLTWPGYFSLMRMPLEAGRDFTEADDDRSAPVAIVNQAFASRYLSGRPPLEGRLWIGGREHAVVGVARTAKYRSLTEPPRPFVYLPQLQVLPSGTALHVRVAPDAAQGSVLSRIRSEVQAIDPRVATVTASLSDATETAVLPQLLAARLSGALASLAVVIAAVGIYGVTAYSVSRRRREIGIRVALGARPREVRRLVLREAASVAAAGLGAGLLGALAVTRLLRGLLIGVDPADPMVLSGVVLLLFSAVLAASWLPARRAARTDPMKALRTE